MRKDGKSKGNERRKQGLRFSTFKPQALLLSL